MDNSGDNLRSQLQMYTDIGKQINEAIIREWVLQGHKLTGKFEAALREPDGVRVSQEGADWIVEGWGKDYWKYIEYGVTSAQIKWPFAKKRIMALMTYIEARKGGMPLRELKAYAFAVAAKHKREGMPQPTASRTGYVKNAFELAEPTISNLIDYQIGQMIENEIKL